MRQKNNGSQVWYMFDNGLYSISSFVFFCENIRIYGVIGCVRSPGRIAAVATARFAEDFAGGLIQIMFHYFAVRVYENIG